MTSEDESRHLDRDGRFLPYSGPHLDQHQQPASSYGNRRPHLDGSARHQHVYANNSRYIEARIKNRMELLRLDERRHTLERQQREATMIIDRNKRKFAEEMANVGRTTSDLTRTAPRSSLPISSFLFCCFQHNDRLLLCVCIFCTKGYPKCASADNFVLSIRVLLFIFIFLKLYLYLQATW